MKDQVSALEVWHLVQELQVLVHSRIDKLYADRSFLFWQMYTRDGRKNFVIDIPGVIYLTDFKPAFDPPKGFAMYLRKRLTTAHIESIEQVRFDRIVKLVLKAKDDSIYHIYLELFGKGNFILCNQDDKILSLMDSITYADRTLKQGETYDLPGEQPDIPTISEEDFAKLFAGEQTVKILAGVCGLGGEYAELVCKRAGVDKKDAAPDTQKLYVEVKRLFAEKAPQHTADAAYPIAVEDDATSTETFSQAIAAIRDHLRHAAKSEQKASVSKAAKDKIQRIHDSQQKQIVGFDQASADNQRKGEILYEHYQELTELLTVLVKERKSLSDKELKAKYKNHPFVVDVNGQTVTVDFDDKA